MKSYNAQRLFDVVISGIGKKLTGVQESRFKKSCEVVIKENPQSELKEDIRVARSRLDYILDFPDFAF